MKYPKGHEFEYRPLYPSQLRIDPLYQRKLDDVRVNKIVREFNGDIFNEPKVSYRDGVYWIFDGQHGTAAWRKLHGDDKPIYCKVFKGMTWLDECDAFVEQNGIAKDPTSNDKLRAAYNAKVPDVVDMVNRASLCGFKVDFSVSQAQGRIIATNALFKAYKLIGAEAFSDMLMTIKDAWGTADTDAVSVSIIKGLATFYHKFEGGFSHDALVKALRRVSPAEIIRNGKAYSRRTNTYSREILKWYNFKRTKGRLDDAEL